jgi:hypothetical protein
MGYNSGVVSTSMSWTLRSNAMDVSGIRYLEVVFLLGGYDIWIDDVSFLLGG